MLQEVILKDWDSLLSSVGKWETNAGRSYYKIYFPDLTEYGSIRRPYISYFGKNVLVQKRMKYGKPTRPDEFSVHTYQGVWLMNIHESWISSWTGREFDVVARPYKPLRTLRNQALSASVEVFQPIEIEIEPIEIPPVVFQPVEIPPVEIPPVEIRIESMGDNLRQLALKLEFNELWDSISSTDQMRLADLPHDDEMSVQEKIAFIKADQVTNKVENVIPRQDFSNLTFEQLFEV